MRVQHWFAITGAAILALLVWTAWPAATPRHVDVRATKAMVRAYLNKNLVRPEDTTVTTTAIGRYLLGGIVVCGTLTSLDSSGNSIGTREYYVVIQHGQVTEGGMTGNVLQDPSGAVSSTIRIACDVRRNLVQTGGDEP